MMATADGFNTPAVNRPVGYKEMLSLSQEWCPLLLLSCCWTSRLADRRVSWDTSRVCGQCHKWPVLFGKIGYLSRVYFGTRKGISWNIFWKRCCSRCPAIWIMTVRISSSSRYVRKESYTTCMSAKCYEMSQFLAFWVVKEKRAAEHSALWGFPEGFQTWNNFTSSCCCFTNERNSGCFDQRFCRYLSTHPFCPRLHYQITLYNQTPLSFGLLSGNVWAVSVWGACSIQKKKPDVLHTLSGSPVHMCAPLFLWLSITRASLTLNTHS